ncbi:hypothetical protein [Variovorax sp. UC74_104]|uniref:hypothetical protein n=1 Tax=Variovorax sp. UC74_104 TaxID=3374555 RepID=UPI0037572E07
MPKRLPPRRRDGCDGFCRRRPAPKKHCASSGRMRPPRVPALGEQIRIGNATLRVLPGDGDARSRRFLLVEEGILFTGASDAPMTGEEQVRWIAPRHGFLHSRR